MFGLSKNERLERACRKGDWDKVRGLINKGAVPTEEMLDDAALDYHVAAGDFKKLFDSGATPTRKMLHLTTMGSSIEKAKVLIDKGIVPLDATLSVAVS